LTRDRFTIIDSDVRGGAEGQEPAIRKAHVEGGRELKVADIFIGRIAGKISALVWRATGSKQLDGLISHNA
jgi:hypothetical protein